MPPSRIPSYLLTTHFLHSGDMTLASGVDVQTGGDSWKRRLLFSALVTLLLLTTTIFTGVIDGSSISDSNISKLHSLHRKLLHHRASGVEETNRIWGDKCTTADIVINQGPTAPLPNGIPTYTVEIMNVCVTGCDISRIHLNCGWFSSARLINPRVFKRLRYNDCLVNEGKPLANGDTLSFQYANTYLYPLPVSSVSC